MGNTSLVTDSMLYISTYIQLSFGHVGSDSHGYCYIQSTIMCNGVQKGTNELHHMFRVIHFKQVLF